jgi:hypothetical protein
MTSPDILMYPTEESFILTWPRTRHSELYDQLVENYTTSAGLKGHLRRVRDYEFVEYEDLWWRKVVNQMVERMQQPELFKADSVERHFGDGELGSMNSSMGLNTPGGHTSSTKHQQV